MTKHITVDLTPVDQRRTRDYGILLTSKTQHDFTGRGIHNPGHSHSLDVWDNSVRPDPDGSGGVIDPFGNVTSDRYSFLWSPHAVVISARSGTNPEKGTPLSLGDVVTLRIHGLVLGDFQVRARRLQNPVLVRVDTASSASRQHYIDTGNYLPPVDRSQLLEV